MLRGKQGLYLTGLCVVLATFFDAIPGFWLGLILILIFASKFKILPTSGMYDLRADYQGFARVFGY